MQISARTTSFHLHRNSLTISPIMTDCTGNMHLTTPPTGHIRNSDVATVHGNFSTATSLLAWRDRPELALVSAQLHSPRADFLRVLLNHLATWQAPRGVCPWPVLPEAETSCLGCLLIRQNRLQCQRHSSNVFLRAVIQGGKIEVRPLKRD